LNFPESYNKWYEYLESIDIEKDLRPLPEIKSTQEKVLLASRNLLSDFYSIKSQEILLKRYSIYAPFDGTITEVTMEVGAYVNKGARLGKIINTRDMELQVPVEISSAKWLSVGDKVVIHDEENSTKWTGKIIRKSKNVDETTQSINLFIELKSSSSNPVFKGQYLTAKFKGIQLFDVMRIPRSAVFNSNEVFIVRDSILAKSEIDIQKVSQKTLYFNGLNEGELIVVEPLINASENTRVRILDEGNGFQTAEVETKERI
jgi:RND family efflux transporter MFP subunit